MGHYGGYPLRLLRYHFVWELGSELVDLVAVSLACLSLHGYHVQCADEFRFD